MQKNFIVSDIHSYFVPFKKALEEKGFDENNSTHHLIICGDLFDRGPDTVELFEFIKKMADKKRLIYIRGNHEDLLLQAIEEIIEGRINSIHHSNGTIQTIVDFTKINPYQVCTFEEKMEFLNKIEPLINFIDENCVDYYQIMTENKSYIFCHGWLPNGVIDGEWQIIKNWQDAPKDLWENARWDNGMRKWALGAKIDNTEIICGHYHCSWGHSHLDMNLKEFPKKQRPNWEESFKPYVREGIAAIDSCVHYSGFCNCLVMDCSDGSLKW